MRIALCLLTWNEMAGCRHDVPLLNRAAFDSVYAVDGGSTDGTVQFLRDSGIPVHQQPRPSLNAACHHAVVLCREDAVVFYHPKGTVPPSDAERFREFFEQGAQLVVASRMVRGARNEEDARILRPRKWLVLALAATAAALWRREGKTVWDILHGFRGVTVDAFRQMGISPVGVSVDMEMVVRAYRLRMPRAEFPTSEGHRLGGDTHFPVWSTGRRLLRVFLYELQRPCPYA